MNTVVLWLVSFGLIAGAIAFLLWFGWHFIKVMSLLHPYYSKDKARYNAKVHEITQRRLARRGEGRTPYYASKLDSVKFSDSLDEPGEPEEDAF